MPDYSYYANDAIVRMTMMVELLVVLLAVLPVVLIPVVMHALQYLWHTCSSGNS